MSHFDLEKFRNLFLEECSSLLDKLENELLELESNPRNKELLESIFRAMHTIKGTSAMYGFTYINEFTHIFENIYQNLRDGKSQFSTELSDVSLHSLDHIRNLLHDEHLSDPKNRDEHESLLNKINKFGTSHSEKQTFFAPKTEDISIEKTWLIILHTDEQLTFRGINLMNIFEELMTLGKLEINRIEQTLYPKTQSWTLLLTSDASELDITDVFIFLDDNIKVVKLFNGTWNDKIFDQMASSEPSILKLIENQQLPVENETNPQNEKNVSAQQPKQATKRITVDSNKLDYLMFLVSELVTLNSHLVEDAHRLNDPHLKENIEKHDDLASLFRQNILNIRLIPFNDAALKFQRLIRDLSGKLNKKIEFKTVGIDIELDKTTIDNLQEPLMHIIRNCIDHGIEMPENRIAKGKPESGSISLIIRQGGSNVFIDIKDDGAGIDKEKVRQKAIEKGIIKSTDILTDSELYEIIFLPGFSTAQSLTEVSGRGVGMDAVKQKIKDLRGEIIISSINGEGTTFTFKIPQSLNIIDSLLFKVEDSHFIVPLLDVQECEQILLSDFEDRRTTGTIRYNDQLIPFIDLRAQLKLSGRYKSKVKTVIVNGNNHHFALMVDSIIGEHHAVIRQLTKQARILPIFNATAQLGDGNTAFMIDTSTLSHF